jgi:hypothetical protein
MLTAALPISFRSASRVAHNERLGVFLNVRPEDNASLLFAAWLGEAKSSLVWIWCPAEHWREDGRERCVNPSWD